MKSILLTSFLAISLFAGAQKNNEKFEAMMTKGIGVSFQKFDGLNSRIALFPQYKTLRDHLWTLSLGSMHVTKRVVTQFTVAGGSSLSGDRNRKSSALRFLSGGFDLGYDVIPSDKIMLYPMVGLGAEGYQAVFFKDVLAVNFNDVLASSTVQNNVRSTKFTNGYFTYRLGVGFALKSPKGNGTIGVQAGYTGSFRDEAWKSSESQSLAAAPADKLSRINIGLVFTGVMKRMK